MALNVVHKVSGRLFPQKKYMFTVVAEKALMQCYNSTTFRLVSKPEPEQKI